MRARPKKKATTQPHEYIFRFLLLAAPMSRFGAKTREIIDAYRYKKDTSSYSTPMTALCVAGSSLGALLLVWMVRSGTGILNTDSGGRARLAYAAVLTDPTFGSGKAEDDDPRGRF